MLRLLSILAILCVPSIAFGDSVSVQLHDTYIEVQRDDKSVAEYVWSDPDIPRPHFKQVYAPNGAQITRRYPTDPILNKDNDDHAAYHPGIWLAFGDISGADFWRNKANVEQAKLDILEIDALGGHGGFTGTNLYKNGDVVACTESFTYWVRTTEHGTLLTLRSVFENSDEAFYFGDQEEMGLGIRMATALTVKFGSGTITNSAGGVNEEGTWGKQADWCAYDGVIDGKRTGAIIVPHWDNFRTSWFHPRDYGLMVANPFGKKAMTGANDDAVSPDRTRVEPGEAFTLGFDILLYGTEDDAAFNHDAAYRSILEKQRETFSP